MSKLKLKQDSLSILELHEAGKSMWYYSSVDRVVTSAGQLDWELGVARLEEKILSTHSFKYACLRENHTFLIQHYYHHSTGQRRLTKEEYVKILGVGFDHLHYNLYLVPGKAMRDRGEHRGITIPGVRKEDVHTFWGKDLQKIQLYRGRKLCYEYCNGLFKQK